MAADIALVNLSAGLESLGFSLGRHSTTDRPRKQRSISPVRYRRSPLATPLLRLSAALVAPYALNMVYGCHSIMTTISSNNVLIWHDRDRNASRNKQVTAVMFKTARPEIHMVISNKLLSQDPRQKDGCVSFRQSHIIPAQASIVAGLFCQEDAVVMVIRSITLSAVFCLAADPTSTIRRIAYL